MKTLSAALAALSLAFAGAASAAPVALSFSNNNIMSNGVTAATFDNVFSFVLGGPGTLSALITTHSPEQHPSVNITSAFLQSGATIFDLSELNGGVDWNADEPKPDVETWFLDPTALFAGTWELHVVGEGYGVKAPEGYTAQITGRTADLPPADLPEPAALALLATAAAAAGLSRRRTR